VSRRGALVLATGLALGNTLLQAQGLVRVRSGQGLPGREAGSGPAAAGTRVAGVRATRIQVPGAPVVVAAPESTAATRAGGGRDLTQRPGPR
jgi:hypothetical protein